MGYKCVLLCMLCLFVSKSFIICQSNTEETIGFLKRYKEIVKNIYDEVCSSYEDGEESIRNQPISVLIDVYKEVLCNVKRVRKLLTSTEEECQVCKKGSITFLHIFSLKHYIEVTREMKCPGCSKSLSSEEDINGEYKKKIEEVVDKAKKENSSKEIAFAQNEKETTLLTKEEYEEISKALLRKVPELILKDDLSGRRITYINSDKADQRISNSGNRSIFVGKIEKLELYNYAAVLLPKLQIPKDNVMDYMIIWCYNEEYVSTFDSYKDQSIFVGKIKRLELRDYESVLLLKLQIPEDNEIDCMIIWCCNERHISTFDSYEDQSIFVGKIKNLKLYKYAAVLLPKLQIPEDNVMNYMKIDCYNERYVSKLDSYGNISVGKIKELVLHNCVSVLLPKLRMSDDNQLALLELTSCFDITDFVKNKMQTVSIKGVGKLELNRFASIAIIKFDKDFKFSSGTVSCDNSDQIAWIKKSRDDDVIVGSVGERFVKHVCFEDYETGTSRFTIDLNGLSEDKILEETGQFLREGKIRSLMKRHVKRLREDQIRSLSRENIAALSSKQISFLSTEQLNMFRPDQIGYLNPCQVNSLQAEKLNGFDKEHIEAINPDCIPFIFTSRFSCLNERFLRSLTSEQIARITTEQVRSLSRDSCVVLLESHLEDMKQGILDVLVEAKTLSKGERSPVFTDQQREEIRSEIRRREENGERKELELSRQEERQSGSQTRGQL